MAMTSAPVFLSKLPVGWFSGYLLENFCPDISKPCDGDCACYTGKLWNIIAFTTVLSPIAMFIFRRELEEKTV